MIVGVPREIKVESRQRKPQRGLPRGGGHLGFLETRITYPAVAEAFGMPCSPP